MRRFVNILSGIKLNIRNTIAIIVVLSITFIIVLGYYKPIPVENKELIGGAVNQYLVIGFGVVIAYFFVSSKADVDKQKFEQTSGKPALESLMKQAKDKSVFMADRIVAVDKIKQFYPEVDDAICQNLLS